jgi:uncharacterized protein (TIGR02266 family)
MTTANRRASVRIRGEVQASLACDSVFFRGTTADLSEGGAFVSTNMRFPVGSRVALALTLPEGTIVTRGRVRWVREHGEGSPAGLGISFDRLDLQDRSLVHAYCTQRLPRYRAS